MLAALPGCSTSLGTVALVIDDRDAAPALKVVDPEAHGRDCGYDVFGIPVGSPPSLVEALRVARGADPEAVALRDVQVTYRTTALLVVNHHCIEVRGTSGKPISTITLPTGHGAGHHH